MERLQGPINPYLYGENWEMGFSEQGLLVDTEQDEDIFPSGLENRMPFLQMLQEAPPLLPFKELGFQTLLKLQHFRDPHPWEVDELKMREKIQTFELESCVTHDLIELHSPNKSESNQMGSNEEKNCLREGRTSSKQTQLGKSAVLVRERRKRKRAKPLKNNEEVESQRMTHIAVERNRRRQMNDHLNVLRSLMPSSYIQRGDQASIIGGAINFVKELEQLLHSLESHRRTRNPEGSSSTKNQSSVSSSSSSAIAMASNGFFMSLSQHRIPSDDQDKETSVKERRIGDGVTAENKSETADIEVTVIQTHVNLKIQCERRPRQLVKAIVALEELKLTVLHLNVTTSQSTVLYSFNLKIEDECKLRSADDIAGSVHQIFSYINGRR